MTMICRGVEIAITRGGEMIVCAYLLVVFFFFFFCNHVIIVSRYKKSHAVRAMEKTKPINAKPLPASPLHGKNQIHPIHRKNTMEVWFPRREYAVGQAPQRHSNDRICPHENDPGHSPIAKLRCVRYPIYMTSVLQRSVMTMSYSHIEKGMQLRLDTVCGGPYSGLLPHNTSHRHAVWSIALLTPTSVP